jgi:hypothetical protein
MEQFLFSALRRCANSIHISISEIWRRSMDVLSKNWNLGLTAFGGPPVHFQIVRNCAIVLEHSSLSHLTLYSSTRNL